jgi:hypothetical protein
LCLQIRGFGIERVPLLVPYDASKQVRVLGTCTPNSLYPLCIYLSTSTSTRCKLRVPTSQITSLTGTGTSTRSTCNREKSLQQNRQKIN